MAFGSDKCKIIKNLETLSKGKDGAEKEINIIAWFGKEPKYDIRSWNYDEKVSTKGITLTKTEARKLIKVLRQSLKEDGELFEI